MIIPVLQAVGSRMATKRPGQDSFLDFLLQLESDEEMDTTQDPPRKKTTVSMPTISTDEIGEILQEEYSGRDVPIDYFYIQIRKTKIGKSLQEYVRQIIFKEVMKLPHGWKKVKPGIKWPAMFFGKFPKCAYESERDREERLNREVREHLREAIMGNINDSYQQWCDKNRFLCSEDNVLEIHIMISRCCLYTGPDAGFMDED